MTEFQTDGINGIGNPPEYYFNVTIDGTTQVRSADPLLVVNQTGTTQIKKGDANHDGVVDFADLSILLSNWGKSSNFPDEIDFDTPTVPADGLINTVDFSAMVQLLILGGLVH
jgi:hypothetical protein